MHLCVELIVEGKRKRQQKENRGNVVEPITGKQESIFSSNSLITTNAFFFA